MSVCMALSEKKWSGKCTGASRQLRRALHAWLLGDLGQELVVGAERLQPVDQQLEPWGGVAVGGEPAQHTPQLPHHLQLLAVEQELLVPGARSVDVDRRVDAALCQLAVE